MKKTCGILLGAVLILLGATAGCRPADDPQLETESIPWAVHDPDRPLPPVVDPGLPGKPVRPPSDAIVLFDGSGFEE